MFINLFQANYAFIYALKTTENQWFSDVFKVYKDATLAWCGFSQIFYNTFKTMSNRVIMLKLQVP